MGTVLDLEMRLDAPEVSGILPRPRRKSCKRAAIRNPATFAGRARALDPVLDYVHSPLPEVDIPLGTAKPSVCCFSACRDNQTALDYNRDGMFCGAMTSCLMDAYLKCGQQT